MSSPSAAKHGLVPARIAAAVSGACCAAVALVGVACFVAPAPALPSQPSGRPTILHDSVEPPADRILTMAQVPADGMLQFHVPVEVEDPSLSFAWRVFVDYDPYTATTQVTFGQVQPMLGSGDAGPIVVQFPLNVAGTLSAPYCHRIDFVVAYKFAFPTGNAPAAGAEADTVRWLYNGAGGVSGCPQSFDASAFGDGGLNVPDAAPDQLPVVPESGSEL
jgi:hypothetical protein